MRIAFVCVQNAGRSLMATAFAERERARRNLADDVEIVTGGTMAADHVHESVVDAMREAGIDRSDRSPREITPDELDEAGVRRVRDEIQERVVALFDELETDASAT